jgi:quinohemoprotein ethanol dehydrogenase
MQWKGQAMKGFGFVGVMLAALACSACGDKAGGERLDLDSREYGRIDRDRVIRADAEPHNWFTTGRDFGEQHYSPLEGINAGNVKSLGFAWQYDMRTTRGLEATPIVVDGVLYTSSAWSKVYALDARDGSEIWQYDPKVDGQWARHACCDVVNRGVAVWKGKVYVATIDGRMVAIDAATGKLAWERDTLTDRNRSYTITGAPRIAGDKIVIGNAGAEVGVRGYVTAYDAATGELAWRFYIVPGDPAKPFEHPEMEAAAKTWDPKSLWEAGGGGTAWDAMVYDPELDLLYVGTGNANPYPISLRSPRGGDNLYLASILAIDPDTGRLAWHYQTTPGEEWDYTAVQHMILADLEIGGRTRKVLMQAPKNGFFYVLDRATGELLSAEKYVKVDWASHVDVKTGRPVRAAAGDYRRAAKAIAPSTFGGHNWQPMAFSPKTALVYIPTIDSAQWFEVDREYPGYVPGLMNNVGLGVGPHETGSGDELPWRGALKAWDPVAQKEVWRIDYPYVYNGGLLATAGNLVFQGTTDGYLKAYAADSGTLLAEIFVGTSIMAAPASYAVDGEQFITVLAGYGGALLTTFPEGSAALKYGNAGRIVTFRLGGGKVPVPPAVDQNAAIPPPPPRMSVDAQTLERGERLFGLYCTACHRDDDGAGGFPNLFRLAPEKHELFGEIVLRGAFASRGMASFADLMSEEDATAVHAFLIDRAHELRAGK